MKNEADANTKLIFSQILSPSKQCIFLNHASWLMTHLYLHQQPRGGVAGQRKVTSKRALTPGSFQVHLQSCTADEEADGGSSVPCSRALRL